MAKKLSPEEMTAMKKAFTLLFRDVKKGKKGKTYEAEVEIFAVGLWNGMEFNADDLKQIANAFHTLKENHSVPLKFGHNPDQPFTDGQPALGWVEDLFIREDTLVAKFVGIPEIVAQAITKGLYKKVSVELDMSVDHQGQHYPLVLSGVALLGADIPAVNTLEDLSVLMGRAGFKSAARKTFTAVSTKEDTNMPITAEELAKLKADLAAANKQIEEDAQAKVTMAAETAKLKAEAELRAKEAEKAKSEQRKAEFSAKLEGMVKSKAITPATRDALMAEWDENDVEGSLVKLEFAVKHIPKAPSMHEQEEGLSDDDTNDDTQGKRPGEVLVAKVRELRAKDPNISFDAAKRMVMSANPKLSREYIEENGEYADSVRRAS